MTTSTPATRRRVIRRGEPAVPSAPAPAPEVASEPLAIAVRGARKGLIIRRKAPAPTSIGDPGVAGVEDDAAIDDYDSNDDDTEESDESEESEESDESEELDLSQHVEALLISAVLNTGDYVMPTTLGVVTDWFHAYPDEWDWIAKYINARRRTPEKKSFMRLFPDFKIDDTTATDEHIENVKISHARHMLSLSVQDVIQGLEADEDPIKLVKKHEVQLMKLQSQLEGTLHESSLEDWQPIYEEVRSRAERRTRKGLAGIPTGFPTLDEATGGPQPGEYWVVGARLGMGKSFTAVNMACSAIIAGYTVQFDALEQSRNQVMLRVQNLLTPKTGKVIRSIDLMRGKVDLLEYKKYLKSLARTISGPNGTGGKLYVDDTTRGKVSAATIAAQIERNQPNIVFIDYITLMESEGEGDWRSVKRLSSDIKSLTMEYKIPIVCMAQINRNAGTGKTNLPPGAETLSGSDAIGQDADTIVMLSKPSMHVIRMKLDKYRHGTDGQQWYCHFDLENGRFVEISRNEANKIQDADRALYDS
jgi:replicative DNA helicase